MTNKHTSQEQAEWSALYLFSVINNIYTYLSCFWKRSTCQTKYTEPRQPPRKQKEHTAQQQRSSSQHSQKIFFRDRAGRAITQRCSQLLYCVNLEEKLCKSNTKCQGRNGFCKIAMQGLMISDITLSEWHSLSISISLIVKIFHFFELFRK